MSAGNHISPRKHYRTCHLCEAMCGLEVTVSNDRVESIAGDRQDVYSRGHICPKATALKDLHEDPDRLRFPLRKTPKGWEQIGWEEALDEVADRIFRIQQTYGQDAFATYTGNPTVHNTGTMLYLYDLIRALNTRNRYASHSLDQLPQMLVSGLMFGHQALFPVPDLHRTRFFLILGANPLVSNGSIMSTPDIKGILQGIRQRGGKVVVLDPRLTRTAKAADQHIFIRPGTDVFFLLSFLNVLFREQKIDPGEKAKILHDWRELEALCRPYPPEITAPHTGIPPEVLRHLALEFAASGPAVCYGRMGVSTQQHGSLCHWLINVINILTGNLDRPGGIMFTRPAVDFLRLLKKEARALRWHSRVRRLPEVAGDLPTATLADEILTPGKGQVRGLLTIAGNPVLSAPNSYKMERALHRLDFMVAIDIYLNETTRHADLILPPACGLEVPHYDFVLAIVALRNVANYSPPVMAKDPGARFDWEILYGLQKRLERKRSGWPATAKHTLFDRLTPERRLDLGLRLGPYGVWGGRLLRKDGLSLSRLRRFPHGLDLGPLQPALPGRLFTPDKKVHLMPELLIRALHRLSLPDHPTGESTFLLFGRRHLLSNNSWMHNHPRLMKQKGRCVALMHPEDAKRIGVKDQEQITVRAGRRTIEIPVSITSEVMPGALCIPHGWGHGLPGSQLRVARQEPGVNVNQITDDQFLDTLSGNAAFNGLPVHVIIKPSKPYANDVSA